MRELQIFKNEEFGEIRTKNINSRPFICLTDVCQILDIKNSRDCRNRLNKDGVVNTDTVDKLGRKNQATFIDESNLYKIIFQSRKPEAEKFTEWVTEEVLPSIRKNGGYMEGQEKLSDNELMAKALIVANNTIEERNRKVRELEVQNSQKTQIIGELKPKADYLDNILQNNSTMTVTTIAKDYGMSAETFNKKLHELKIQFKQSGQWFLYSQYQSCGYTHSKTTKYMRNDGTEGIKLNTEWTQKGRVFLYNTLREQGILPLIEK